MTLYKRVLKNSSIYMVSNIIQRFLAFLLLPLYTRFLTPGDYGIVAVVSSLVITLEILFMFSLGGAVTKFYFDLRDDPAELKKFYGTVFSFLFMVSVILSAVSLLWGPVFLAPFLDEIPFDPYMAVAIGGLFFFPVYDLYLNVLQTEERTVEFSIATISCFVLKTILSIIFVVGMKKGAIGPIAAESICNFLFFAVAFIRMKDRITFTIDWKHLKTSLAYSIPLLPHTLVTQIKHIADKLFLNSMIGTAAAGIYNIGFQIGNLTAVIAMAINRAYIPVFMESMKSKEAQSLEKLNKLASFLVFFYCTFSFLLSIFSRELLIVLTTEKYYQAYLIVPFIAFSFAARGIYFLFVNTLFFYEKKTKLVAVISIFTALLNIALNYSFIQIFSITGAAAATMTSQIAATIFTAYIAHKYSMISWEYVKYAVVFALSITFAVLINRETVLDLFQLLIVKSVVSVCYFAFCSFIFWKEPFYIFKNWKRLGLFGK